MSQLANKTRDVADEMAAMYGGCDDPLHPFMPVGDHQQFRDWLDFVDKVARPLVEADGNAEVDRAASAMLLYRKTSPYFICSALVMAANRGEQTWFWQTKPENCRPPTVGSTSQPSGTPQSGRPS